MADNSLPREVLKAPFSEAVSELVERASRPACRENLTALKYLTPSDVEILATFAETLARYNIQSGFKGYVYE